MRVRGDIEGEGEGDMFDSVEVRAHALTALAPRKGLNDENIIEWLSS